MAEQPHIDPAAEERFWRGYMRFRRRRKPWLMFLFTLLTFGAGTVLLALLEYAGVDLPKWLVVVPLGVFWIAMSVYMYRYTACPRCGQRPEIIFQRFFPETCPRCGYALESQYRDRAAAASECSDSPPPA